MSTPTAAHGALPERITAYLSGGGLFNPELANHDAVRDLLIECRAALSPASPAPAAFQYGHTDFGFTFPFMRLSNGDCCLMALLVHQFGSDHRSVSDLEDLFHRATSVAPSAKTVQEVIYELWHYNPAADEYKGEHIHKGWAKRLEQAIAATPAQQTQSDAVAGAMPEVVASLPRVDDPRAVAALDAMNKEYDYPCNPANCARYGWEAARRYLVATPPQQATTAEPNYKPMFDAAAGCLAEISDALGINDESASCANGNDLILEAIQALHQEPAGQPLTDEQIEDLRADANRGYNIEREDYFKAFRDAEEAHGIGAAPSAAASIPAPVAQQGDATPCKSLNALAADLLRPYLRPGQKVIWREAFRWHDDEGVLSNHYDGMEIEALAADFGYDWTYDFNFKHAAIVGRAALKEAPGASK